VQGRYVYFVLPLGQGLTLCEVSVFGSIASAAGASVCRDCPAHTFSGAGSKAFVACTCNEGYTGPDGGECTACDAGGFKDTNGSAACTLCSQGKYSAAGASVCIDCTAGKFSDAVGASVASTCGACGAGKYSAGATGAAACVLTPPSPDTCYGAAAMIDLLNASCPRDHATQKTTSTSCGTSACAFFISAIDDRKFALVKAGLQECADDSTNPFTGFSDWLPKWNDELIRHHYAKYCGLPFGIPLWAKN